jgi:hypothetical protein
MTQHYPAWHLYQQCLSYQHYQPRQHYPENLHPRQ